MPFKDPEKRKKYDREHKREFRKSFPEEVRKINKKSYEKNKEKYLKRQQELRKKDPEKYKTRNKLWRKNNPKKVEKIKAKNRELWKKTHIILKKEVFSHYSKSLKCVCCGVKGMEFLTVDHIIPKKEMVKDKKSIKRGFTTKLKGEALYKWLKQNGYPKGFQILCWNCNFAKGVLGKCPHQK
jgi:hypothetical protein